MKIVIATIRKWNIENAILFKEKYRNLDVKLIFRKEDLIISDIIEYSPDYIFFPHWSYYIPQEIFNRYRCIVFHPADLPYGRGGSPIQNQIINKIEETKICAIDVNSEIDSGNVYLKRNLSLIGSGQEIFIRMSRIVFDDMIPYIIENNPAPVPQEGEIVYFRRRKPEESVAPKSGELDDFYDFIRMLDADDYPKAFIKYGDYRLTFSNVSYDTKSLEAKVIITRD